MEPHDPIGELDFLSSTDRQALRHLARELLSGDVVLFAGAGLSFNARRKDGDASTIPGWPQLAVTLKERFEKRMKWTESITSVADYYEVQFGRHDLIEAISHAIRDEDHLPGRVHERIVALNFREIITTNYDTLIERAFEQQYVVPQVVTKGLDLVRRRQPPRIIKMNGCLKNNPSDLVITGNDFLSYSHKHPLLEIFVLKSFVEAQVLFIGFSLDDPSFRAINESVLRTLGENCPMAYALQFGITQEQRSHWQKRYVSMIDLDSDRGCGLEPEERLFRVLDALVRDRRRSEALGRRSESLGGAPAPAPAARDQPTEERISRLWASLGREIGLDRLGVGNTGLRALGRSVLLHTDSLQRARGRPASRRFIEYLEHLLEGACSGAPGTDDRIADLREPLLLLVELGLGQSVSSEERFRARTPPELMALLTLLSFELLLRAPGARELRILSRRFARCVDVTSLEGLTLQSMPLRSRYLTLLALFAPLPVLARLVATWIGPAREESLLTASSGDGAGWTFQATPREYRLPLLGMFAVLERHPGLLEQAAESLWSRQLDLDGDPALAQRVARESAYRFRYLMQAAGTGLTSWTSGNLQVQRLDQILSRLFLEDPGVSERRSDGPEGRARPRGPAPDDAASALHTVVFEIQRGWIFGSPSPRSFHRLWSTADALFRRAASPHSPSVEWSSLEAIPWELLLLMTPAIEGRSAADRERYAEAAQRLWENDLLDPVVLIDLLRLRLGTGRLGPVPGATVASLPDAPVRHEIRLRLAWLIRWLTESVQSEDAEGVPLPTLLAQRLLPVIRSWLPVAEEEEEAEHLVQALIRLREHDGTTVRKIIEDWLQSPVAESRGMPLHLSELDPPPDGDAPHSGAPILSALDWRARWKQAIESRAHGARRYSNDVLLWSIGWSDRFRAPERRKMGQGLADLIRSEAERQSFDWLRVAAAIQERHRLRDLVDRRFRDGENSRGLAGFVFRTLEETERGWPERWRSSRDFSLAYLAAFARDVVEEDLPFLERALDLESLTSRGCEGAVKVLVALLAEAPLSKKDRAAIHKRWIEQIARAIDRGANGRGELGALNGKLSPGYRQKLQDNLIRQLERDSGADFVGQPGATRRLADVVGWVHETLEGALRAGDGSEATVLSDLEERLVEGVASPHAALADACIASVMEFNREFPDFADRNRARLRRVLLQVDGRGSYRKTSRFARNLATLRELVATA